MLGWRCDSFFLLGCLLVCVREKDLLMLRSDEEGLLVVSSFFFLAFAWRPNEENDR